MSWENPRAKSEVANKHGGYGSRWITVPNFFPEPEELDDEDWYYLFEGYGGGGDYETKPSGKHYKRVRTIYEDSVDILARYCGFDNWHEKWKLKRWCFGLFRSWTRR